MRTIPDPPSGFQDSIIADISMIPDDNLDTNLSKLNAILHNMNITKSALLDVNKSNLVNQ